MNAKKILLALLVVSATFSACKKDDNNEATNLKPTAENIEIGTANNKRALRGRDFHFNADVIAVTKISDVRLNIKQKSGETYTANWKFELVWDEYKGAKNTNVHKHFTIPADAPEGKYDFYFTVTDENGSKLELKETLTIIDPDNLPVDPKIDREFVSRNDEIIYSLGTFKEKELIIKKGEELKLQVQINDIKDEGVLYSLLIKRKSKYYPESIDKLDFNKVIVVSKVEHQGLPAASKIRTLRNINGTFGGASIVVGVDKDNNEPVANSITGKKAWESGQYDWVILYKNTTHNVSVFKSVPITIDYK